MTKLVLFLLALAPLARPQFYNIQTIAGNGRPLFAGNGGSATNALLIQPAGIATDSNGNVFFSDTYYDQVFEILPNGTITVFAGTGQPGFSGDGGPAASAQLFAPLDLAVDSTGNVYICDYSNARVRKVAPNGTISTIFGFGTPNLGNAYSVAVDNNGNLYFSLENQHVIKMMTPSGAVSTIAGTGVPGYSGDGGQATSAMLSHPHGIKVDKNGNLYIADNYNHRIRKVTPQGIISTFAGSGKTGFAGDGGSAANASLFYPTDIAIDANGNVYIADATNVRIRKVDTAGFISTVAGGGNSLNNGPALQARLDIPAALAIDNLGNLVFPLAYLRTVRRVTLQGNTITTIAGSPSGSPAGDGGPATGATLLDPYGIAADTAGNVFVSDQADNRIRKINTNRIITTYGGNGVFGGAGDGGIATSAQIGFPRAAGLDGLGNFYLSSPVGAVVRRIGTNGVINTVAGNGTIGFAGDGGQANAAKLDGPIGVVGDAQGNFYISETANARIRKVTAGIINTIAGTGVEGFSGDGGPAISAKLYQPRQMVLDSSGNLYVAEMLNHRIRKITPGGIITTYAGSGNPGFSGDGGPATAANVGEPTGLAIDGAGNLYIATASRIRKVDAATGIINTIAGTGAGGFSGDGGLATLATMNIPLFLASDAAGNIYITDEGNQRVRQLTPVQIVKEAVANAATFLAGGVAPGEIITIYSGPGILLGPAGGAGLQLDAAGRVGTQLGGIQALFDGVPAPLTFVNAGQINAVVPYEIAGKTTTQLQVTIQGKPTNTVTLPVVAASPGCFAITNADGSVNTVATPSAANGVLVMYCTGEGLTAPAVPNGTVNSSVFPKPLLNVTVKIGGQDAQVLYAGAAPGFVAGVLQVNVQIPPGLVGTMPIQLTVGTASTPSGVNISVAAP